ncbi:MAG: hypothetical protein ACPKPY_05555 [Nitrososphaeraceae archaeon]
MPQYNFTFHTGISDKGIEYLQNTYGQNIISIKRARDFLEVIATATNATVAENVRQDLLDKLIVVNEIPGT